MRLTDFECGEEEDISGILVVGDFLEGVHLTFEQKLRRPHRVWPSMLSVIHETGSGSCVLSRRAELYFVNSAAPAPGSSESLGADNSGNESAAAQVMHQPASTGSTATGAAPSSGSSGSGPSPDDVTSSSAPPPGAAAPPSPGPSGPPPGVVVFDVATDVLRIVQDVGPTDVQVRDELFRLFADLFRSDATAMSVLTMGARSEEVLRHVRTSLGRDAGRDAEERPVMFLLRELLARGLKLRRRATVPVVTPDFSSIGVSRTTERKEHAVAWALILLLLVFYMKVEQDEVAKGDHDAPGGQQGQGMVAVGQESWWRCLFEESEADEEFISSLVSLSSVEEWASGAFTGVLDRANLQQMQREWPTNYLGSLGRRDKFLGDPFTAAVLMFDVESVFDKFPWRFPSRAVSKKTMGREISDAGLNKLLLFVILRMMMAAGGLLKHKAPPSFSTVAAWSTNPASATVLFAARLPEKLFRAWLRKSTAGWEVFLDIVLCFLPRLAAEEEDSQRLPQKHAGLIEEVCIDVLGQVANFSLLSPTGEGVIMQTPPQNPFSALAQAALQRWEKFQQGETKKRRDEWALKQESDVFADAEHVLRLLLEV